MFSSKTDVYRSWLPRESEFKSSPELQGMYERIWDESDYVIPPAENSAFFIMTNFVLTPNQTRSTCPEDHTELPGIVCQSDSHCEAGRVQNMLKGHGQETGRCVPSDRAQNTRVCEVDTWCPVERDLLPAGKDRPMIPGKTVFTNILVYTR